MIPRRTQWAAIGAAAALAAAALGARALLGEARRPDRAVLVYDRSSSRRGACDAVVGAAAEALAAHRWGRGGLLVVLATGDASTLGEPVEAFRFGGFRRQRTVDGQSGDEERRRRLLADVRRACEALPPADVSPVYLAARRGAELLSGEGCSPGRCSLTLVTDGEETSEPWMAAAIRGEEPDAPRPARIPNARADVRICGLAEVAAPTPDAKPGRRRKAARPLRDGARADRIAAAWRGAFSSPSSVSIEPVCAKLKGRP